MRQFTLLLAIVLLTTSTVGCGCCRRLRDRLCRGSYCGASAVAAPAALTSPQLIAAPMQAPVQTQVVPQMRQPMMIVPQPQMMTNCVPCDPCYDPCGGYGYYGAGYGAGLYDSGWSDSCGCPDTGYLTEPTISSPAETTGDPGPEPATL